MQDGTRLQFKSTANGKYLSIENGGGGAIRVDAIDAPAGETFRVCARITFACVSNCFNETCSACLIEP